MAIWKSAFCILLLGWAHSPSRAQESSHLAIDSPFGSFVEEGFPFFMQTLDAREFGEEPEDSNLTPRGIVVKIGFDHFGCFDPDLLKWSLIWRANENGEYLTMDGMGPGSYRLPNRKAPAGQESLPKPLGTALSTFPALPGWSVGLEPNEGDPRERGDSDEGEIGLGPIPESLGRYSGLRLTQGEGQRPQVIIEYSVGKSDVTERLVADPERNRITRSIHIAPHSEPLFLRVSPLEKRVGKILLGERFVLPDGHWIELPPSSKPLTVKVHLPTNLSSSRETTPALTIQKDRFWPESISTSQAFANGGNDAFVFDDISLPVPNPWNRNVRLAGFDFFRNGKAAFCTFDGDVWIVDGLGGKGDIKWSRFASGLHEPKTVCIVNDEIFISCRNGITRLHDLDGNGEADFYENFSNVVAQTAETREFAMDMVATEKGSFILAKGGQVGTTRGRLNGTIVEVSPDGRSYEVIATGLRQPYLGYDPEKQRLTSSDQQGHWKPATPIYLIEEGHYYGFQPAKHKDKAVHPAPISPPEVWIPHFINPSGASQVWAGKDDGMGPLNDSLIHIGYNRPEIFKIFLDSNQQQGAVVPVLSGFPAGPIKGRIHPQDGLLYLSGFEIWGTSGERISGLFRVRPSDQKSWIPKTVHASRRGILIEFDHPLDPDLAKDPARYSVDRWNYQQTHNYGSGNFKLNGEPGQEAVPVASARLSEDGRKLFLGVVDMQACQSLRVTYRLPIPDSMKVDSAYLTIHSLSEIDLRKQGFSSNEVSLDWDPSLSGSGEIVKPSAELGSEVAMRYGCIACHAIDKAGPQLAAAAAENGAQVAVGPAWLGLWNSKRTFTDGSFIKNVDETYLRESILDPNRRVAEGFQTETTGVGMPSYLGVLKDHEVDSLILFIKTLRKKG
ncbi:MAG: DUF6797 domain-containing protein [Verrucomicrobiota bacterium]